MKFALDCFFCTLSTFVTRFRLYSVPGIGGFVPGVWDEVRSGVNLDGGPARSIGVVPIAGDMWQFPGSRRLLQKLRLAFASRKLKSRHRCQLCASNRASRAMIISPGGLQGGSIRFEALKLRSPPVVAELSAVPSDTLWDLLTLKRDSTFNILSTFVPLPSIVC